MTRLVQIALCLTVALVAAPLRADQRDPRLDALFADLRAAETAAVAAPIEREIWNLWIESDDDAVTLLMRDGVAAMARQDYRTAEGKFDQVVAIAPAYAEGWNKRATVRYLRGDYQGSLADIEETLAREPRHFGALSGRGLVYIELDEPERALEALEAALAIHPFLPGAAHNAMLLRRLLDSRDI